MMTTSHTSPGMVVTDLDGTLSRSPAGEFGEADLAALRELGEIGVTRVVATGRSLHMAEKVLPKDFPIDYLVFSSGAGILDWNTRELLISHHLEQAEVEVVGPLLVRMGLDFMIHHPIPDNHHFLYHETGRSNPDFALRRRKHETFSRQWTGEWLARASQFVVVARAEGGVDIFNRLTRELAGFSVIRATSPLDGRSLWLEIFSKQVSKSQAAAWIAHRCNAIPSQALAVGNDYNDLDLLHWAGLGLVVGNAPDELKVTFSSVASHKENGFAQAVRQWRAGRGRR